MGATWSRSAHSLTDAFFFIHIDCYNPYCWETYFDEKLFSCMAGFPGPESGECKGKAEAVCGGQSGGDVVWRYCHQLLTIGGITGHAR